MKRLLILPAAAVLLLAACGDSGEGGDVTATLTEWQITTDRDSQPKGAIVVDVKNDGERDHELIIVTTDIPVDELPTREDGSFDKDAPGVSVKEEFDDIDSGDDTSRTYQFDPGTYIFLCNRMEEVDGVETSHFAEGMATEFTVRATDEDGGRTNTPDGPSAEDPDDGLTNTGDAEPTN